MLSSAVLFIDLIKKRITKTTGFNSDTKGIARFQNSISKLVSFSKFKPKKVFVSTEAGRKNKKKKHFDFNLNVSLISLCFCRDLFIINLAFNSVYSRKKENKSFLNDVCSILLSSFNYHFILTAFIKFLLFQSLLILLQFSPALPGEIWQLEY